MNRDQRVYIADIIESIQRIQSYLENVTESELTVNPLLQDAVYRRFEIIGEASSRLSEKLRLSYPEVEWRLMKAMRNKIAHEYYNIQVDVVFNTVQNDFPSLLTKLKE